MKKTSLLFYFILLYTHIPTQAQDFRLLEIGYTYYPEAKVKEATSGQKIIYREFGATLKIPVVLNQGKTVLINSLTYSLVRPEVTNAVLTTDEANLHYIGYSLTAVRQLGKEWNLIATVTPAISSSLKGALSNDDFLLLSSLMIGKKVSDTFSWNAGLAYTTRFGQPLVIPVANFRYEKNSFKLQTTIPYAAEAIFSQKHKKLEYGLRFGIQGSQFNLSITESNPIDVIRFSRMNLGPKINYKLKGPASLFLFTGLSLNRRHKLISSNIGDIDFGTENGFFFNIGFFISPAARE